MTDNELLDTIKVRITTINDTTQDDGYPSDTDSEPAYICDFNEPELFKKLYSEMPELYENNKGGIE